jgi:aminoglycoside phosphotransferase (APT) family kinase protein
VFVKAVGPEPNELSPGLHRREIEIVSSLPEGVPVPRLLWSYDDEWVVLVFEDVEGREPSQPWQADELERVLETADLLERMLTPSPVATEPVGEMLVAGINSWHLLRDEPPASLDEWSLRHLDELAALEAEVADAVVGDTLVHLDIRADNILLTDDGRVYFVDWPHAHVGAAWLDAVAFAPSVTMQGGPEPEYVLSRWPGGERRGSRRREHGRRLGRRLLHAQGAACTAARAADAARVPGRSGRGRTTLAA